ncbi:uncharacterized protein LOC118735019 [Rhagoletis pomonella]|uniref:uncharacterized protein LOC118735019 n=1 Tax=Rhagoletis pomonella TaxID=28610 RepID=UPI001785B39B|nr:uncharacterized protein LOC118735019 [Rhagoletis pomonella]
MEELLQWYGIRIRRGGGSKVIAYADDLAVVVSGKFPQTLCDIMQDRLRLIERWTKEKGLGVNPEKTDLVLFTRKYKIPSLQLPAIGNKILKLGESAKYLGVVLDKKLNWAQNIQERVKKATVALYSCKGAIGRSWGLSPSIMYWLYTVVVRPILLYGVLVWWPSLNRKSTTEALQKVQRTAMLCICGALRTTPSEAMCVLLDILPIEIVGKQSAGCAALRLRELPGWRDTQEGHTAILKDINIPDTDYCAPRLNFTKRYRISIPDRKFWSGGAPDDNGSLHLYTDGSKLDGKVGGGVFSARLGLEICFRLPNHCSVFQAEVAAIQEAVEHLRTREVIYNDIFIYSDSQAALKALDSVTCSSKTVADCRRSLNEMAEQSALHLVWVPGHRNIPGNEKADELAREGTSAPLSQAWKGLGMPLATCKLILRDLSLKLARDRWDSLTTCNNTKLTWPKWDKKRSKDLLMLSKGDLAAAVGLLTGHVAIGGHAERLGIPHNDFCRSCRNEEEPETLRHLLCECPALCRRRQKFMGSGFFEDLTDIAEVGIRQLLGFAKSTRWFE